MMKQKKLLFSLLGICILLVLISCSEEDKSMFGDDIDIPELTDTNTIQFTVDASGEWKKLEIIASGGPMAIEWGDGRLQKVAKANGVITYRYRNNTTNRVRIWAEELDFCSVGDVLLPYSNLRIGIFPKMKKLLLGSFMNTKELNLSVGCPNLENVQIGNMSDLMNLSISGCAMLKTISIASVPKLTSFDSVHYPYLTTLFYSSTGLTSLSLKGCPELTSVSCWNCTDLSVLEVHDNSKISTLDIRNCAFSSAEFLKKMPLLQDLDCSFNNLTKLDLSVNENMIRLDCSNNQLETISLSPLNNLHDLYCHINQLTASALNNIFDALREYSYFSNKASTLNLPKLSFYENQGSEDCNRTLFQKKRWSEIEKGVYGR